MGAPCFPKNEFGVRTYRSMITVIAFSGALLLAASPCLGQFRTPEWKDFHNNTFVGDEPEPIRIGFFSAEEHRGSGRELEAGREYLRIARSELSGRVRFGERLVLPSDRAAALKLLSLSADTLDGLRDADAGVAARIWAGRRGPTDFVTRELLDRHHPLDPHAERACYEQGLYELLAGHPTSAAAYFERIVHWPGAHPGELRAAASVRLRQCLHAQGRAAVASALLRWPDGEVRVAGEPGPIGDGRWRTGQDRDRPWTTFLGDDTRVRRPRHAKDPERPARWSVDLPVSESLDPDRASHRHRYEVGLREDVVLPCGLPVVLDDRLIELAEDGVHFRSLEDGSDLFPVVRWDFDLHVDPERFEVDLDGSALCVADRALFVNLRVRDRTTYPERSVGALFRLDLTREAYVEAGWRSWEQEPGDTPGTDPWAFAGPPVAVDGRLFLPAMRLVENDTECELFHFDPRTLELRDRCFLARDRAVDRFADRFSTDIGRRLVSPTPVSARNGVLYVCTNLGVVAAVRAADRSLEWMFRYNRMVPVDSRRYSRHHFYVTGGWPSRPVEVLADRLLVAPSDSRYLYSLARWPNSVGDLVLNDPVEKESRLAWVGADAERLFFLVRRLAGRTDPQVAVQCTDHSGSFLWQSDPLPILEPPAGLPAQTDRYLYIPTDRLVYRVDLSRKGTWDLVLPPPDSMGVPYPEIGAFGDLMVTDRWLVSRSARYLTVFAVPK